ncbi:MAG: ATP synthase subunit I [Clostridia bacterium]|nr:ATP synthase subunit I [Clostridia bacterium]
MFSKDVLRQIRKVSVVIVILGAVMTAVFAALGRFDMTVAVSACAGCLFAIFMFILLAFFVERSVTRGKNGAQASMFIGYVIRMALTALFVFWAIYSPDINLWAAVIPLLFTRIAIMVLNIRRTKKDGDAE